MGLTIKHRSGTDQELEMLNEPLTGLLLQDPKGQIQQEDMGGTDVAGGADYIAVKSSFGTPFIIECTVDTEENGGAATTVLTAVSAGGSDVFPVYDSDATALTTGSPFKFKVLDCLITMLDESAGSVGSDTVQLMKVDDDGTTETAITDAMDLNKADDIVTRPGTLFQDACVIDVTENLRFDVVLASSTTHATCFKAVITCMRCIADE